MKPPASRTVLLLALLLFIISGAAGMMYEISWSRQFGRVFGHTPHTGALVLSSFLGGLALGYWLAGRFPPRDAPLASYGRLELLAAAWACAVPTLLALLARTPLASLESGPLGLFPPLRALSCFLLLLPTTAALGATWPRMAAFLAHTRREPHRLLSWGYALNTAGAVLGGLTTTALLLVTLGVTNASYLAAAVSAACGVAALALARAAPCTALRAAEEIILPATPPAVMPAAVEVVAPASQADAPNLNAPAPAEIPARPPAAWAWWLLVLVSGFAILALEVFYLRLFSLVFHNSTYTFTGVITVFLLALAAGAALVGLIGDRLTPAQGAGIASAAAAVGLAFSLALFAQWTGFRYFTGGNSFLGYSLSASLLVFAVVFPPITFLGTLLPTAWRALARGTRTESRVAGLTAASTAAGACGSLAAGEALPWLGLWGGFAVVGAVYALIGLLVLLRRGTLLQGALLVILALPTLEFAWRTAESHSTLLPGDTLLRRWESRFGWIDAVRLPDDSLYIRQNLHYGFGNSRRSVRRDYRQGHVPLLLHGRAERVAFLGMGTGQTAAAALAHEGLEEIVVVELIPEAVEAARYLENSNRGLVDHPRVEIRVDDARRFLQYGGRRFDCIIADLFVPWESQTGYLYTVEHYEAGLRGLNPDGLFCQWLPLYQMGAEDFELIADSFAGVFPHATFWWAQIDGRYPVAGLLGSRGPIEFPAAPLRERWPLFELPEGGRDPWLAEPRELLTLYVGRWRQRNPGRLNTEEHPRVEFSAPIAHGDRTKLQGERLLAYFDDVLSRLEEQGLRAAELPPRAERLARQRRMLAP